MTFDWSGLFGDIGKEVLKFVCVGVTAIIVWEVTLRLCDYITGLLTCH